MSARDDAARWLAQATADRHTVKVLVDGGVYYMACFVAQQAAEKALKAFLYASGEDPVFGRSVYRLCSRCGAIDPAFAELAPVVKNLDQYYIETRYPNGLPDQVPAEFFDQVDAERATEMTDRVLELVRTRLDEAAEREPGAC